MNYQLINNVKAEEVGLVGNEFVIAPITIKNGLNSVLVPVADDNFLNKTIYDIDLNNHKQNSKLVLSEIGVSGIASYLYYQGFLFLLSPQEGGLIYNEEKECKVKFLDEILGYGRLNHLTVINRELIGATYKTPTLVKFSLNVEDLLHLAENQHIEALSIEVIKDLREDISNYFKTRTPGFISSITPYLGNIAILASPKYAQGKVFIYTKKGKKKDEFRSSHMDIMSSKGGLLYIPTSGGITIYDPKKPVKRIKRIDYNKDMHNPQGIATFRRGVLVAHRKGDSLEFSVFKEIKRSKSN